MKTILPLLSVALLLGTAACHEINDEPPDYQFMRESRPIGTAKEFSVNLEYDIGMLEISKASSDSLFSFDLQYNARRTSPKFEFNEGDRASLRLDVDSRASFGGGPRGGFGSGRRDNDLTLRLNEKVSLDLDIRTGVTESHLDLTGLAVRSMQLHGGVGKTDVTFDEPVAQPVRSLEVESGVGELIIRGLGNARVERLDLKGGVGRTELDYSGDLGTTATDCTIKVGVGQVHLLIPRDADIEIYAEGSFLSNISAPDFERDGRTYTHHGGNRETKIKIRVESGIGGVTVELI